MRALNRRERKLAERFENGALAPVRRQRYRDVTPRRAENGLGEERWTITWQHDGRTWWLVYSGYSETFFWARGNSDGEVFDVHSGSLAKFRYLTEALRRGRVEAARKLASEWRIVS